ncbi:unnamed protein product [Lactuca virosa]|uniref:Uncharacterized protein n=1 Tax=Lactuca virosa TaxID=75947 RepID=A0AAU9MPT1_9ASTR|nr:unnamed protein product [Lactuca virosa]
MSSHSPNFIRLHQHTTFSILTYILLSGIQFLIPPPKLHRPLLLFLTPLLTAAHHPLPPNLQPHLLPPQSAHHPYSTPTHDTDHLTLSRLLPKHMSSLLLPPLLLYPLAP